MFLLVATLSSIPMRTRCSPRDGGADRQALQHEFVHYLLTESGLPDEQNIAAIDSPYSPCGLGVNAAARRLLVALQDDPPSGSFARGRIP